MTMHSLHRFQIHYRLHDRPCHFEQRDTVMSDADAWYYASLHSGTSPALQDEGGGEAMLCVKAREAGLSDVRWLRLD